MAYTHRQPTQKKAMYHIRTSKMTVMNLGIETCELKIEISNGMCVCAIYQQAHALVLVVKWQGDALLAFLIGLNPTQPNRIITETFFQWRKTRKMYDITAWYSSDKVEFANFGNSFIMWNLSVFSVHNNFTHLFAIALLLYWLTSNNTRAAKRIYYLDFSMPTLAPILCPNARWNDTRLSFWGFGELHNVVFSKQTYFAIVLFA